jgi:hypothetical protein
MANGKRKSSVLVVPVLTAAKGVSASGISSLDNEDADKDEALALSPLKLLDELLALLDDPLVELDAPGMLSLAWPEAVVPLDVPLPEVL